MTRTSIARALPLSGAAAATAALTLGAAGTAAAAAENIHYENAGTFPSVAACADAGRTTPGTTTWLCDENPDGTATLYVVPK